MSTNPKSAEQYDPSLISPAMFEIIRGIPNYDPFRGSQGCWFDESSAQLALDFFAEMLVHIEGDVAGQPFVLEPWQASIVANLFGWKKVDGKGRTVRRYRELFVYVPRKNGKTPLCAGIGLFVFFIDDEVGQQGYIAAKDREQAGHLFRQMLGMVERNEQLDEECTAYGGNAPGGQSKSFVKPDASFLKVISGDGAGKHGGNPHLVIIDEVHEQKDRELMDALRTSMVSDNRKQSLMVGLTTADHDEPSICNDQYDYAKRVQAEPESDPAYLPVIYEALPTDDPYAESTWYKCNPNLGVSVSLDEFRRMANKAQHDPGFNVEFKRLHLNLRTRKLVANAIKMDDWDACEDRADVGAGETPFDLASLVGRDCWAGLDFGWRDDYAALVLIFPMDDGTIRVLCWFWIPDEGKRDKKAEPTQRFIASNMLSVTNGSATDIEAIYDVLREARRKYSIRKIVIDPNNAGKQGQDLMNDGFEVYEFVQSMRNYTEPWLWLMAEGVGNRKLRHGGHPILRWMAGNVAVEVNGTQAVMPKKKRSLEKIDGICALCMGIGSWLSDNAEASIVSSEIYTL